MFPLWLEVFASRRRSLLQGMIPRRRMDDIMEEEIERRLDCFETDVVPAVGYFSKYSKYNFIELDGGQAVDAAQQELLLKASYW